MQAIHCPRTKVEQAGHTSLHGDVLIERIRKFGIQRGGGSINRDRRGADFHGLRNFTGFEDYLNAGGLVDENFSAFDIRDFEAGLLHLDGIHARDQGRKQKGPFFRSCLGQAADGASDRDLGPRDHGLGCVVDQAAKIAAGRTLVLCRG